MNSEIHYLNPVKNKKVVKGDKGTAPNMEEIQHMYGQKNMDFMPTPIGVIYEESSLIGSIHDESQMDDIPFICQLTAPNSMNDPISRGALSLCAKQPPSSSKKKKSTSGSANERGITKGYTDSASAQGQTRKEGMSYTFNNITNQPSSKPVYSAYTPSGDRPTLPNTTTAPRGNSPPGSKKLFEYSNVMIFNKTHILKKRNINGYTISLKPEGDPTPGSKGSNPNPVNVNPVPPHRALGVSSYTPQPPVKNYREGEHGHLNPTPDRQDLFTGDKKLPRIFQKVVTSQKNKEILHAYARPRTSKRDQNIYKHQDNQGVLGVGRVGNSNTNANTNNNNNQNKQGKWAYPICNPKIPANFGRVPPTGQGSGKQLQKLKMKDRLNSPKEKVMDKGSMGEGRPRRPKSSNVLRDMHYYQGNSATGSTKGGGIFPPTGVGTSGTVNTSKNYNVKIKT